MHKNFGSKPTLLIGSGDESLMRFDLSTIPSSAAVTSATLELYVSAAGDGPVDVHRATAPWSESSVTFASFGQHFKDHVAGKLDAHRDGVQKSVDLTKLVRHWVTGAKPNDGILLESSDGSATTLVSREGGTPMEKPELIVCYTAVTDDCAAAPCQNGGTCDNTTTGFTCECAAGFTGTTCQTNINDCAANPCQNGGACVDGIDSYTCTCLAGFAGSNCEANIDDCAPDPCQNGGVCEDGIASYTCTCPTGYSGTNCETLIDDCDAAPCQNGGTCSSGVGSYTCTCPVGFTGTNCEINIDDCTDQPCNHGGTCVDGVASYTCTCPPDWGGPTCNVNLDTCAQAPCLNGGACIDGYGSFTCACAAGFTGANCEVDINDCAPDPCQNAAICVDGVDSYTCTCPAGFTGVNCETNIDDCAPNPCQNGGVCVDGIASYTCQCRQGFTGPECGASTITMHAVVRDFPGGIPTIGSAGVGDTQIFLGADDYPFLLGGVSVKGFIDAPGVDTTTSYILTLDNAGQADPTVFAYDTAAFAPLPNGDAYTFEINTAITYTAGLKLRFAGPGPANGLFWVYVNRELIITTSGIADFDAIAAAELANGFTSVITPGETYALDIYYVHDAPGPSTLHLETTRPSCSPRSLATLVDVPTGTLATLGAATVGTFQTELLGDFTFVPTTGIQLVASAPPSTAGAVWGAGAMQAGTGFRTQFHFLITPGAEGFALVMARAPGLGAAGANLGYAGLPSIAIEFDTHSDAQFQDPPFSQIAIHSRGAAPNSANQSTAGGAMLGGSTALPFPLGVWNYATVEYEPEFGQGFGWVRVYIDTGSAQVGAGPDPNIPVAVAQISDATFAGALGTTGFVMGFTSSTDANVSGEIDIADWRISAVDCRTPSCTDISATFSSIVAPPEPIQLPSSGSSVVQARDSVGMSFGTGGAGACFAVAVANADGSIPGVVTDDLDGTYTMTYAPSSAGTWEAFVRIDGVDIAGSPYPVSVLAP